MSKQLKYQLKKTIKEAEFVHADLEYHEEVGAEAAVAFKERIHELFSALPRDVRDKLEHSHLMRITAEAAARKDLDESEDDEAMSGAIEGSTDLIPTDIEPEEPTEEEKEIDEIKMKGSELKKLFRRIAAISHPDKLAASGVSKGEVEKMEKIFKRARAAFDRENWFILYTLAVELGMDLDEESESHLHWIQQDIKNTLRIIQGLADRTYWHWFMGETEESKNRALRHYFLQIYNFEYPGL